MEIAIFVIAGIYAVLLGKVISKDARIKVLEMNLETAEYKFRHELEQHNNTRERMKTQARGTSILSGSTATARYRAGFGGFVGGIPNVKPDPELLGTFTDAELRLSSRPSLTEESVLRILGLEPKEPPTDTSVVDWLENKNGK